MVSRIEHPSQNPSNQQPRKAEDTDTRQAIQRHDPEFYKDEKNKDDQPGFKDPYEDLADVSVPALKNFLLGLLDRVAETTGVPAPAHPHPVDHARHAATPQAAAAVSAYQTGARRGSHTPGPMPVATTSAPVSALDQAAAGLDRASVLDLIRDLDRLYAEGVTAIALEKGDGFLASIRAGIDRARGA